MSDFEVVVDFSQIEADEWSVVKPGEYDGTITKATIKKKDEDGGKRTYPYIAYEVTIDEGQEYAGAKLFFNSSLSPEGSNPMLKRAKFLLLTLGVDLGQGEMHFQMGPEGELINPNVMGLPVHCWVNKREWNNQPQANVYRMRGTHEVDNSTPAEKTAEERYK